MLLRGLPIVFIYFFQLFRLRSVRPIPLHCICGHSVNQNGDYGDTKKLVAGKVKIYRVRTSVIVGGTERRVSIPVSGNEATVINDTF